MSDTPRTDACQTPKHGFVPADFARKLERELAVMTRLCGDFERQRNALVSASIENIDRATVFPTTK